MWFKVKPDDRTNVWVNHTPRQTKKEKREEQERFNAMMYKALDKAFKK